MSFKILYVEDDATLAFLTSDSLAIHGYDVRHCADGKSALEAFESARFDICILDIMLPKMDGFDLATRIRKSGSDVPIIFLSAKTLKEDRIKGLKLGADDYLVKPFSIEELLLKINVFLKRSNKTASTEITHALGTFRFDHRNRKLFSDSVNIVMTGREAELLKFFIDHKNVILKREEILKSVWGDDDYFMGRSLDVFISRLRKLVLPTGHMIENLHGIGFRFTDK